MLNFLLIISETIPALRLGIPTPRTWKRPLSSQKGASPSGFGLVSIFPLWMGVVLAQGSQVYLDLGTMSSPMLGISL